MIELVLEITSRSGSLPATVRALRIVMSQARVEHACLDCRLYSETGNAKLLRYVEQWPTLPELESQVRSQRFGMLLAIMETAASPPKLEIRTISEQRDLEYVSAVRLNLECIAPVKEGTELQW